MSAKQKVKSPGKSDIISCDLMYPTFLQSLEIFQMVLVFFVQWCTPQPSENELDKKKDCLQSLVGLNLLLSRVFSSTTVILNINIII